MRVGQEAAKVDLQDGQRRFKDVQSHTWGSVSQKSAYQKHLGSFWILAELYPKLIESNFWVWDLVFNQYQSSLQNPNMQTNLGTTAKG